MRKNLFVRSIAAVSGIVMLASLAACGDNTSSAGNNSGSTSTEKITGSFSGAGATSQQAAEEAWISAYMAANSGANVTYNPTGSGAGVTTFLSGATAWAGSDKALSDDEVTQSSDKACANGTTAFDVPVYISPIAIIFNLKGVSDAGKHINLDADTAVKQADGTIGYADFPEVGDLSTAAIKVGENYNEISADAGSKVIEDSEIDTSVKGDNRVVVKINHATKAKGAYPIVLVSYDIACPAYKDANTAKFVKSWLTYVTSDEGQKTASSAAGSAPLPSNIVEKVTKSIEAIKTK